jgi:hypothetical protein
MTDIDAAKGPQIDWTISKEKKFLAIQKLFSENNIKGIETKTH